MDWKNLGTELAKIGLPLLGAALPVPGGAAIGTALAAAIGSNANPEDILSTLTANADAMAKAREFQITHEETMLKLTLDAEIATVQSVNTTMQTEAKSEHWPTWSWRPFIGFIFGISTFGIYMVLPLAGLPVPSVPESVWGAYLAILGVASWHRGSMQVEQSKVK